MGRKYEFKVSNTPSPMKYQPDRAKDLLGSRSRGTIIRKDVPSYVKPKDVAPAIGKYYDSLPKFGENVRHSFVMGGKPGSKPLLN